MRHTLRYDQWEWEVDDFTDTLWFLGILDVDMAEELTIALEDYFGGI